MYYSRVAHLPEKKVNWHDYIRVKLEIVIVETWKIFM